MSPEDDTGKAFRQLAETKTPGLLRELRDFLLENKKWWLLPIILFLLLLSALVFLTGTGVGPLIYPFF